MIGEKLVIGNQDGTMKFDVYRLVNSTTCDINLIVDYKCNNIFEYDYDLELEDKNKIRTYVEKDILVEFSNFQMIIVDNKVVGTIGVIDYEDGKMIDEIFILEGYRNRGIGTDIITTILNTNDKVYLWVYKENIRAIKLYKRLGFEIIEETDKRNFMMRG